MRNFIKYIPFQLTLFLVIGILTNSFLKLTPLSVLISLGITSVYFAGAFFYSAKNYETGTYFKIIVFLLMVVLGMTANSLHQDRNHQLHYSNQLNFKSGDSLKLIVKINKVLKPSAYYNKFEAEVEQLFNHKTKGKILLNIIRDSLEPCIQSGAIFYLKSIVESINKPLNPHGFNYKKYLERQYIYHQVTVESQALLPIKKSRYSLKVLAASARSHIISSLQKSGLSNSELAVVSALLLGQRQHISKELMDQYSKAGAIHILAVSGLHIGIILMLLTFCFKPLEKFKNGKLVSLILIVVALWLYALLAGLSASVVRAVTMFTAIAVGLFLNRPTSIYNTLVMSMFFLLLVKPGYLFDVGFQLSYLAVFSIVWIQPKLEKIWTPKIIGITKVWQLFTVSIAAQIGVLPLSLYYFHQFPGLFFLSNLIIVPFLGIVLTMGIIVIISALFLMKPFWLAYIYQLVIKQLNTVVEWIGNQEGFIFSNISFSIYLAVFVYILIIAIFKYIEKRNYYRLVAVLVMIITLQGLLFFEKYKLQSTNEFVIFHKLKNSLIVNKTGNNLTVYTTSNDEEGNDRNLLNYKIEKALKGDFFKAEVKNLYQFNNEIILVVDSLGNYNFKSIKPSLVLLRQSPKINLERLINTLNPKKIIVDGSNYKSYIERWQQTCIKNKTPFHYTGQKGALILR